MVDNAYDVKWRIEPIEVNLGYGRRGRPGKGDSPRIVTEYRVNIELSFNEERAVSLSQDRGVRVLVTNLPRSMQDEDNIRSGATADTVLKTYLGQSRIEHAIRIMKDGMSMDRVYLPLEGERDDVRDLTRDDDIGYHPPCPRFRGHRPYCGGSGRSYDHTHPGSQQGTG